MKKFLTLAVLLAGISAAAQTAENIYSVTSCPGEDASECINVSWAADSTLTDTYVMYSEIADTKWRRAKFIRPEQQEFCTVFDGVYSKTAENENFYENARFLKCGASISGLAPDTEYKYAICSGKRMNRKGILSKVRRFKTAGASEWSCCVISDFHSYPPIGHRLSVAMDMFDTVKAYDPSIDWVLHVGDVCAWGGSYSFWKRMYEEKPFEDYFWAGVNGNHDNMTRQYRLTNDFFRYTDYYPRNGYEGEEGVCYHFRYGEALFIMLNNENMRSNDLLLKAQRWVKDVVTKARQSADAPKYIIVCEHYQWFYGGNGAISQYRRWHDFFDELGVDLAIAGNNHIYVRTGAIFDGVKTDGGSGTVYLQTSSCDDERGELINVNTPMGNADLIEYRWTEGRHTVSAVSMKVNPQCITIALLDRSGNVLDTAVIPAKEEKITKQDILGDYYRDSLDVFKERCQKTLDAAYMADKFLGTNDSIPGWEGYPVSLYEYYTGPDKVTGQPKKGLVYMLNPDADKLARWIINAVWDATGDVKTDDLEAVRKHIMWQSGAQFPVKGVVYEDMYGDGYYPYIFKDGVTVYMKDEEHHKSADAHPGEELLQFYVNEMSNDDLKDYTGRYARIASTNRQMYYAAGGQENVGDDEHRDLKWLDVVAHHYQEAWKSDRNFLIYCLALYKCGKK